jgi:hypothetical protein
MTNGCTRIVHGQFAAHGAFVVYPRCSSSAAPFAPYSGRPHIAERRGGQGLANGQVAQAQIQIWLTIWLMRARPAAPHPRAPFAPYSSRPHIDHCRAQRGARAGEWASCASADSNLAEFRPFWLEPTRVRPDRSTSHSLCHLQVTCMATLHFTTPGRCMHCCVQM